MEFNEHAFMSKMKSLVLVGALFLFIGLSMQITAIFLEFGTFIPVLEELGEFSKAEKDAAEPGSHLLELKTTASEFPSKLLMLKLVGIGQILVGIFMLLFVIVQALRVMPFRIRTMLIGLDAELKRKK